MQIMIHDERERQLLIKFEFETCMPFIENSLGIDVPDSVIQHPIIEKLHTAANDIVCWGNVSGFSRPVFNQLFFILLFIFFNSR